MCYVLDACKNEADFNPNLNLNVPYYPKYIFNYYLFKNIINNWQDGDINNNTIKQTVDKIKSKGYSNLTLALSLSEYLEPLSESLCYLFEGGFSFERLVEWYEATFDKDFDIKKFLHEISIDLPNKLPYDLKIKIRETVRFAIYFYHNTLEGFRESVKLLNKTLDVMNDELKERIIDRY
jgi:predicted HTH domain antitoxin